MLRSAGHIWRILRAQLANRTAMTASFYIVRPERGPVMPGRVGTVLHRCSQLHIAVAVCHSFADTAVDSRNGGTPVIVESAVALREGDAIMQAAAVRIFESDGTRF
jgi:hypothetical protein